MSHVRAFTIRNYYTREIPIDDGVDGDAVGAEQTFPVRVRRFTVSQLQEFQRGFARVVSPTAERFIFRTSDSDEQALRADGRTYVVPQAEVERRRQVEMDEATSQAYEAASRADDDFMSSFCSQAIADHVWLPPGVTVTVIQDDDSEVEATDGPGLVLAFGGNLSMLVRLTRVIHEENTLSPEAKKALRSLSASTVSSPTPAGVAAAAGATPDATAADAGPLASAASGAVSAAPAPSPSGSTET